MNRDFQYCVALLKPRTYFRGFNALDTFTIDNYNVLLYRKIIELEPTREH